MIDTMHPTLAEAFKAHMVYGGDTPAVFTLAQSYRYHRQNGMTPAGALAAAKSDVDAKRTRYGHHSARWQALGAPFQNGSLRWAESPESLGFIDRNYCDEVERGIDHRGWFLNTENCGEKARGEVFTLPHRRGFVAGVADPYNKGPAALDVTTIFDDADDAARYADRLAETYAENERDYNEASNAWFRACESIPDEIKTCRRKVLAFLKEVRGIKRSLCGNPEIIATIRDAIERSLAVIAELRAERDNLESCYNRAKGWRDNLPDAATA